MESKSFSTRLSQLFKAPLQHGSPSERNYRHGTAEAKVLKDGIIKDLASQSTRIPTDLHLLMQLVDMKAAGGYEDDSRYIVHFFR